MNAGKQKWYREGNKKNVKEKDRLRKKISHEKFKNDFPLLHAEKVKEESAKIKDMPKPSQ